MRREKHGQQIVRNWVAKYQPRSGMGPHGINAGHKRAARARQKAALRRDLVAQSIE